MRRGFGLRDRVMLAYGLLALGLSGVLAFVTFGVVSNYLTDQRTSSAIVETSDNAATLHYGLYGLTPDCTSIRRSDIECATSVAVPPAKVSDLVGALGRLASTVALRPLAELTQVAAAVARGRLDARLEAENDPDLGGLARSFNHTAAALEKRVVADARFAGDISHELRTPLMTMMNSMQLIQNHHTELPASVREPVRIADLVRAAADATAGREITDVAPDATELSMEADKRRLERVIANLVDNAEQHAGGCKGVSVKAGGIGVIVYVDDAGPGVSLADRERIFERFGRGGASPDSRTDAQRGGIGLGLAIVARHVEWHPGTIKAKDRPEGGARFIIELPAQNP